MKMSPHILPCNFRTVLLACSVVVLSSACAKEEAPIPAAVAQTVEQTRTFQSPLLTDGQVKAQYQNCPGGWYAGPQPGKARYTKDPWHWVVTPDFARRFCMPEEFVSTELKGAEAIAFKLRRDNEEENCGFGGNPDACGGQLSLRFEIYVRSDAPIPKRKDFDSNYFQVVNLPSKKLISRSQMEQAAARKIIDEKNKGKVVYPFIGNQVGLHGMKNDAVAWPIATMYLETYFGTVFQGIDYYAFDASLGFLNNPGVKQSGVNWFAINFSAPDLKRHTTEGMKKTEFQHTIVLPQLWMERVIAADKGRENLERLMDKAFGHSPVKSK